MTNLDEKIKAASFDKPEAAHWVYVADDFNDMVKTEDDYNVVNDGAGEETCRFIAIFDPEHITLMEAEHNAPWTWQADDEDGRSHWLCIHCDEVQDDNEYGTLVGPEKHQDFCARGKLLAYRKEHGYE